MLSFDFSNFNTFFPYPLETTLLVNYFTSIEQGCYPNAWKMGQVTPLFKKDDESNKANYRPVTVLPVLNNIYEKLLAAQLGKFYGAILSDFISSYRKL